MEFLPRYLDYNDLTYKQDIYFVDNFLEILSIDHTDLFEELLNVPIHDDNLSIDFEPYRARRIQGSHKSLCSRGNPLKRHKIWFQDNIDNGYIKYSYTGWQNKIALAQCDISAMPIHTQKIFNIMKTNYNTNHGIFTAYKDENDCIPFHSDKLQDITENSWIIIIKLGADRFFDISKDEKIIFHEKLKPGTAIFMKSHTSNIELKHSVPKMENAKISGSLVFRDIKTIIPWTEQIFLAKVKT